MMMMRMKSLKRAKKGKGSPKDPNKKTVLSNGYVRLVDCMGSDLSVVNAARASYEKESLKLSEKDEKLIYFLAKENHWSPFRHAFMTLEFKAPLMVARQHWKYVVGSDHTMDSWNESSRRYITGEPDFYLPDPDQWRGAPENLKQGSGPVLGLEQGFELTALLSKTIDECVKNYEYAMDALGVAPEQARLFLPAYGMNVIYRWSCSLQSVGLFLNQRLHDTAQAEISDYANAVADLVEPLFPISLKAIMENLDG